MANEKRRLIDANSLILAIRDDAEIVGKHYARIKMHINGAPTVDAVEVVRCKDCKHYMLWEDSDDKKTCAKSIGLMVSSPDDFCSYGERKD